MSAKLKSIFAPAPGTVRGYPFHLSAHPANDNFVYCSGTYVVIRNLKTPAICDLYTGHIQTPTVAKYSNNGYFVASGDVTGQVRVWDTVNPEHLSKIECIPVGNVSDLAFSMDDQRLAVVGDGKECPGNTVLVDTGASIGRLLGHTGRIVTCDFKPSRPFRVVTGGEDAVVSMHEGPPFKFKSATREHSRFVNCIRYNSDGSKYVSVGGDGKQFIYDGKDGSRLAQFMENGHKGSIYSCSWSPDCKQLLTAGADKTAKLWDIETLQIVSTFTVSENPTAGHMLLGTLWKDKYMLAVGFNEDIYYLDMNVPNKPHQVLQGHAKPITNATVVSEQNSMYTVSGDGKLNNWDLGDSAATTYAKAPDVRAAGIAVHDNHVYVAGTDKSLYVADESTKSFSSEEQLELPGPATGIASSKDGTVFVATTEGVAIVKDGKTAATLKVPGEPLSIDVTPSGDEIIVGSKDTKLYVFKQSGSEYALLHTLQHHKAAVSAVAISPDGTYIASGDHNRIILLWDKSTYTVVEDKWVFHTSRINGLSWSPNSKRLVSAGSDSAMYVWNAEKRNERIAVLPAHLRGVNAAHFLDDDTVISAGQDQAIKVWTL